MESSEENVSSKCDDTKEDSGKTEGTYIEERKRNVDYLDLNTENTVKSKSNDAFEDNNSSTCESISKDSITRLQIQNDEHPPGEEKQDLPSFENEFSEMYTKDDKDSSSKLKRTIAEANFNNPENQYLTLDEIEERKKAKAEGTKGGSKESSKSASTIR